MTKMRPLAVTALLLVWSTSSQAQSADEIIDKHLAASGGRAAIAKITSRKAAGTISVTTPIGELGGTVELYAKAPNKTRTYLRIDLSGLGGGEVINDQRFDGTVGYVIDTFNGNRDITGSQLDLMRAGSFPTPLLNYKDRGFEASLAGHENVNGKDVFALRLAMKSGPAMRLFIDAATFLLVKTAVTVNVPQLGGDIEQVTEFSDFRDVDGIKVAFVTKSINPAQTVTATMTEITHNVEIEDGMFAKPAQ